MWHAWLEASQVALTLATVPFYVVYLTALVRQRGHGGGKLASAFFTLSLSVGVADLYHFFNSWLGRLEESHAALTLVTVPLYVVYLTALVRQRGHGGGELASAFFTLSLSVRVADLYHFFNSWLGRLEESHAALTLVTVPLYVVYLTALVRQRGHGGGELASAFFTLSLSVRVADLYHFFNSWLGRLEESHAALTLVTVPLYVVYLTALVRQRGHGGGELASAFFTLSLSVRVADLYHFFNSWLGRLEESHAALTLVTVPLYVVYLTALVRQRGHGGGELASAFFTLSLSVRVADLYHFFNSWLGRLEESHAALTLATVPFYVVYLTALVRQRGHGGGKLASAFFTLSLSVGVADLYHFFNSWLGRLEESHAALTLVTVPLYVVYLTALVRQRGHGGGELASAFFTLSLSVRVADLYHFFNSWLGRLEESHAALTLVTVPLYVVYLTALVRQRGHGGGELASAFFTLSLSVRVADLYHFFNSWLGRLEESHAALTLVTVPLYVVYLTALVRQRGHGGGELASAFFTISLSVRVADLYHFFNSWLGRLEESHAALTLVTVPLYVVYLTALVRQRGHGGGELASAFFTLSPSVRVADLYHFFNSWQGRLEASQAVLTLATVPLYVVYLTALVRQRGHGGGKLASAFFKLSLSVGVADLYHFFNSWLGRLEASQAALILATVPLYVVYLTALVRQRGSGGGELTSAFFTLSLSVGVADLYHFFNSWLGLRRLSWMLPLYLAGGNGFAKFVQIGSWMVRSSQGVGILMITVNRFTMVWWPVNANAVWSERRTLLYCLLTQWGVSACYGAVMLCFDFHWKVDNTTGQASPVFSDGTVKRDMFLAAIAMEAVICPAVIVLYALAYYKMTKKVVRNGTNQPSPVTRRHLMDAEMQRRLERNLTACGLIICGQEVIWTAFLVLALAMRMDTASLFVVYGLTGDIYAASNPWVLLAMSQLVRNAVRRTLGLVQEGAAVTQVNGNSIESVHDVNVVSAARVTAKRPPNGRPAVAVAVGESRM